MYWEKAADVLCNLGIEVYHKVLPEMIKWMKDMNWPGAQRIYHELTEIDDLRIISSIEISVSDAIKLNDMEWLYFMAMLIDEIGLEKFDIADEQIILMNELKGLEVVNNQQQQTDN